MAAVKEANGGKNWYMECRIDDTKRLRISQRFLKTVDKNYVCTGNDIGWKQQRRAW